MQKQLLVQWTGYVHTNACTSGKIILATNGPVTLFCILYSMQSL